MRNSNSTTLADTAAVAAAARLVVALVFAAAFAVEGQESDGANSTGVYDRVMSALESQPNRLPGSARLDAAFAAVQAELERVGYEPEYQTFATVAQATKTCVVRAAGKVVEGVHALNNGISPLNTGGPIAGPLIQGGDGRLQALAGKQIEGAVVLIDSDLPGATIADPFMQGAEAMLLVGSEAGSVWRFMNLVEVGVASVPAVYVPRTVAEKSGLLDTEGIEISLEVACALKQVEGRNLWVAIPPTEETVFDLDQPEAIVVSATLDTYGMVPDFTPDVRKAANAALLTEVLCGLADRPRKRTVIAVFYGSHYSAQEGARFFMYGVGGGRGSGTKQDILSEREEMYADEAAYFDKLIEACSRDDILVSTDSIARELVARMKEWLSGKVNNINAQLRDARVAIRHLEIFLEQTRDLRQETKDAVERYGAGGDVDAARNSIVDLEQKINALTQGKKRWNDLRQLIDKQQQPEEKTVIQTLNVVQGEVRSKLQTRRREIDAETRHNASHKAVYEAIEGKEIVANFDFDFARDDRPWTLGVIGVRRPIRGEFFGLGSFLRHFSELGVIYADIRQEDWRAPLFEETLRPYFKPSSLSLPGIRFFPTLPGTLLGIPGFQMMTVGSPLDHDGMPVREEIHLAGLAGQMTEVFAALATRGEFSLKHPFKAEGMEDRLFYEFVKGDTYKGTQIVNFCRGSSDVEGASRNSLLVIAGDWSIRTPDCPQYAFSPTNVEGRLAMPMINTRWSRPGWVSVCGIGYDAEGTMNRSGRSGGVPPQRMTMFYCYGGGSFNYGFGPDLLGSDIYEPQTVNGRNDAAQKNFFGVRFSLLTTYYTDEQIRFKRIGGRGEMILAASEDDPTGVGVPLRHDYILRMDGVRQCASDYWILNESRLAALRRRNIVYDSLEEVHAAAKEHLVESEQAKTKLNHSLARAHDIASTCLSNRVYGPLRGVTDDLVRAVVLLLLLNIPFAFAMERLICGFTSIYKQVAGFVVLFIGTFLMLFFTHPAFSLASAPIVIFLAFVIILLGVLTLYIVLSKIKQEIRAIQGLASTVHGKETDSNSALAAVLIGISGMRNRPLKTFLTATTVTLLTFTILVFGSFTSEYGIVETYLGKGRGADRVEMHTFSYLDIPEALVEAMHELYADSCHVIRRGGIFLNPAHPAHRGVPPVAPDRVIYCPGTGQTVSAGAIFGLQPEEASVNADIAKAVNWDAAEDLEHPAIFLSSQMAGKLEPEKGDHLQLMGRDFSFAGVIDEEVLRGISTIDEKQITPPDFASTMRNMGLEQGAGRGERALAEVDVGLFEWLPASQIAIADFDEMQEAFGPGIVYTNYVLLYPRREDVDLREIARDAATVFQGATHVKNGEGARKMFFSKAVAGSGFGDVAVPLLLGGLIIFSSLMGSIVDREREIFTYSALGLSPPSVGALFFAESAVYSVVGGMGGYLLSQLVAKLLTFMGSMGWFRPPAMNFSSFSSVMTILIVMAVVMLSTIFPAIKAGRSANPGVARKWKMPLPDGDDLTFVFPFTVSEPDFKGILSFIHEHFENHADATLGGFAAREVKLFRQSLASGKESLGIQAEISLAPFDLGIFQTFRMYSQEFEIRGIDEVVLEMHRIGGTRGSWIRSTRNFAAELREQFLLWRALPIETVEHYRAQTDEALSEGNG